MYTLNESSKLEIIDSDEHFLICRDPKDGLCAVFCATVGERVSEWFDTVDEAINCVEEYNVYQ